MSEILVIQSKPRFPLLFLTEQIFVTGHLQKREQSFFYPNILFVQESAFYEKQYCSRRHTGRSCKIQGKMCVKCEFEWAIALQDNSQYKLL